MTAKRRIFFAILAVVFLLWLVLVSSVFEVRVATKVLMKYIASGRSQFKILFALLWFAVCFIRLASSRSGSNKVSPIILICSALILFCLNAYGHYFYILSFRMDWDHYSMASFQGEISSNAFYHTHIMKAILGWFVDLLGLDGVLIFADPGIFFYSILPTRFVAISAVFFFLLLSLLIYDLPARWRSFADANQGHLASIYLLSSFVVLLNVIDGGFLTPFAIVYFPAWILLLTKKENHSTSLLVKRYLFTLVVLFSLYAPLILFARVREDLSLLKLVPISAGCLLVLGYFFFAIMRKILGAWVRFLCLFSVFVAVCYVSGIFDADLDLIKKVSKGDTVYVTDDIGLNVDLPEYARVAETVIYRFSADQDMTIGDIYKRFGLSTGFNYVRVENVTCNIDTYYLNSGMLQILDGQLPEEKIKERNQKVFKEFALEKCRPSESCDYSYKVILNQCIQDSSPYQLLNQRLRELGLNTFIMVPYAE